MSIINHISLEATWYEAVYLEAKQFVFFAKSELLTARQSQTVKWTNGQMVKWSMFNV